MARIKKERTLLERVLDREDVDFTRCTMLEIKQVINQLVDMNRNGIRKIEILKIQDLLNKANEQVESILNKNN